MKHRDFVAAPLVGRAFAFMAFTVALILSSASLAQQKAQPKTTPKAEPKGAAPAQRQPEQPKIVFAPWTKVCPKGPEANAKAVCATGRDGTLETGMPVVAAVLVEPEGEPRKTLRITLPLGMSLQPGTRVVVDQGQPITAPYVTCIGNGCIADYEASGELIANMKKGKDLALQGVLFGSGQMVSLVIPLADFAKAYDGAPTDPKVFEEAQRKRFEEFQKKAAAAK